MMTVALISTVRQRLEHLITTNPVPVKDNVELICKNFSLVEDFLKEKKKTKENSGEINDLENLATQLAYNTEDVIESMHLQQNSAISSSKLKNTRSKGLFKFSSSRNTAYKSVELQRVMGRSRELIKLCKKDIVEGSGEDIGPSGKDHAESSRTAVTVRFPSREDLPKKIFVGMEDDFARLQYLLLNDDERYKEVSNGIFIQGMSGIGKTTLAQKLFEDLSSVIKFDCRAWARMGRNIKPVDIAASILGDLSVSSKEEIQRMETTELMHCLNKAQKGKKCLIVLDDVLSIKDWEAMKFALPPNKGTRMIITTRVEALAEHANGFIHKMKLFNHDESSEEYEKKREDNETHSWHLFKKHSGKLQDTASPEQKALLARLCRGLPLAITVFGGMVRAEKLRLGEAISMLNQMEDIHKNQMEDTDPKPFTPLGPVLDLSYKHLPFELKACFLYLGYFPVEQVILLEKLYPLWMAEGLIPPPDQEGKSRMDVAQDYLLALVQRNLVMLQYEDFSDTPTFRSCELHDIVYELCMSMGRKEGFFEVDDPKERTKSHVTRRIAIYLDTNKDLNISEPKHIRSLLFFGTDGYSSQSAWPAQVADLSEFLSTRVLDFDGVDFQYRKLPKGIEKLIFLRYLSFRGCNIDELPLSFRNFAYMETLDLRVRNSCKMKIPNILWKMKSLLHLFFPVEFQSDTGEKLNLGCLTKLETLENFHAGICDADDLPSLQSLQIFKGIADGNNEDLYKMITFLHENQRLHQSSLVIRNFDCYSAVRIQILTELLRCDPVHTLDIEGHLGVFPPHVAFGLNFTEIVFKGSELDEDPMPMLGKLPNLKSLVLCNDAFVGKKMECKDEGFPNLRCLKLAGLWFLREWIVESGAMPLFSSLTVEKCPKLETLPGELMDIISLKEVTIRQMPQVFQESARALAEERRSTGDRVVVVRRLS